MGGYMPSEVARMVLGYLKETSCLKTRDTFLLESYNLKEYAECLQKGNEYPTSIAGKSLTQILQDYYTLTHLDLDSDVDKDKLLSSLDRALLQVKHLVKTKQINSQQKRLTMLDSGVSKRQSFLRQQARKKFQLAKRTVLQNVCSKETQADLQQQEGNTECVETANESRRIAAGGKECIHWDCNCVEKESNDCRANAANSPRSTNYVKNAQQQHSTAVSHSFSVPNRSGVTYSQMISNTRRATNMDSGNTQSRDNFQSPNPPVADIQTPDRTAPSPPLANARGSFVVNRNSALSVSQSTERHVRNLYEVFRSPPSVENYRTVMQTPERPVHNQTEKGQQRVNPALKRTSDIENIFTRCHNIVQNDRLPNLSSRISEGQMQKISHSNHRNSLGITKVSTCDTPNPNVLNNSSQRLCTPANIANDHYLERRSCSEENISRTVQHQRSSSLANIANTSSIETAHDRRYRILQERISSQDNQIKISKPSLQKMNSASSIVNTRYNSSTNNVNSEELFHSSGLEVQNLRFSQSTSDRNKMSNVQQQEAAQCNRIVRNLGQLKCSNQERSNGDSRNSPVLDVVHTENSNHLQHAVTVSENECNAKRQDQLSDDHLLELHLTENLTPQNSVEPALPTRFPEDFESPRYLLSQQRSSMPSLTTPVKDHSDQSFYSPRRKSLIPRRRLLPSAYPFLSQQPQQQETEPIVEELINFPPLIEKLAENINKVVQSENNPETSELEATITSQGIHIPDSVIKDIITRTESDPVFEEVLSFICEKYDSSRDSLDSAQNVNTAEERALKSSESHTAQVDLQNVHSPSRDKEVSDDQESPLSDSSHNPLLIVDDDDCNNIEGHSKDGALTEETVAVEHNVPQISIPESAEIIITSENLLSLKNGPDYYKLSVTNSSAVSYSSVAGQVVNSRVPREAEYGTYTQVIDKPIMSAQTSGTYVLSAAAITPVKFPVPDLHFLTLSPSQIFGMPTLFVDQSPEKPILMPKTNPTTTGMPKPRINTITANRNNVLINSGRQPLKRSKPLRTENVTKTQEQNSHQEKVQNPQQPQIQKQKKSDDDSVKTRMPKAHIRTLDFGVEKANLSNSDTHKNERKKSSSSRKEERAIDLTRSSSTSNPSKHKRVQEDADKVVAATLVSLSHSRNREHGKDPKKLPPNKRKSSTCEQAKKKQKNQDSLLKEMDVEKFLSKIHPLR